MSAKNALDAGAGLTVLGTLFHNLPTIAAGLSVIWFLIRIYEWARVVFWRQPPRSSGE